MNNKSWLLKTESSIATRETSAFTGFIYGQRNSDMARYVLDQMKFSDVNFLKNSNGLFCGYVQFARRVIIFNDRYGFGKVYISQTATSLVAGTDFNEVVGALHCRTPDTLGMLEFLRFGYPLGDRTFLEEVKVLPPGSFLEFDYDSRKILRMERYWQYTFPETNRADRKTVRSQLIDQLESAVYDCFEDTEAKYAIANSGGLDSRTILAIAKNKEVDYVSYTFGSPDSDAIIIANKIAKLIGSTQINIPIKTDFLPKYWQTLQSRRPMITLASAWYYSGIEELRDCNINICGIFGDNTLGVHLVNSYLNMKSEMDLFDYHSIADETYLSSITPLNYREVKSHYQETFININQPDLIKRFDEWNFENRQFRFISQEPWVNFLDVMESRCPFMNNKLVDFAFALPFAMRRNRVIYQEVISLNYPSISAIRLERLPFSISDSRIKRHLLAAFSKLTIKSSEILHLKYFQYPNRTHKQQKTWLLSEPNFTFISDNLRHRSPIFSEMFFHKKISKDIRSFVERNWSVASNVLTLKLWLERYL